MAGSFKSSRSLMFTRDRRIPICTYRSPLALGRELTVPFKFMVSTLTPSPIFNFFGEMVFFGPFSFLRLRFLSTLSSFSRSFVRSASSSFPTPEDWGQLIDLADGLGRQFPWPPGGSSGPPHWRFGSACPSARQTAPPSAPDGSLTGRSPIYRRRSPPVPFRW